MVSVSGGEPLVLEIGLAPDLPCRCLLLMTPRKVVGANEHGSPVCLWRPQSCFSDESDSSSMPQRLLSMVTEREVPGDMKFAWPEHIGLDAQPDIIGRVVSALIASLAFPAEYDVEFGMQNTYSVCHVHQADEYGCLIMLLGHGLVELPSESPTRSSWRMTRHGVHALRPCMVLEPGRRFFTPRVGIALKDMTALELYSRLQSQGFRVRMVSRRVSRRSLAVHSSATTDPAMTCMWLRSLMTTLPRFYMLALVSADMHQKEVEHLQPEAW